MTSLTSDDFILLRKKIDSWTAKAATLQGQLNEIKRQLKNEFDVESIDQAKELQAKLKKQYDSAENAFKSSYNSFKEKWETLLN
jgi:hypothetical protein